MNEIKLERLRKEIKAAIRYEFIDGIVILHYDPIKNTITITIKYTEDDSRRQAQEEFRLETIQKHFLNGPIDWKQVLDGTIQKYGKNRNIVQETNTNSLVESEDVIFTARAANEDDIPTIVDVTPDAETVVDNEQDVETSHKVKKVARFDEWKEVR